MSGMMQKLNKFDWFKRNWHDSDNKKNIFDNKEKNNQSSDNSSNRCSYVHLLIWKEMKWNEKKLLFLSIPFENISNCACLLNWDWCNNCVIYIQYWV